MSDWASVRRKLVEGKEWRGSANVPIDGETYELAIRMLPEEVQFRLLPKMDLDALREHREDGMSEAEETVQELQSKDEELTDEEEDRLEQAQERVREQRMDIMSDLGEGTYEALMEAGVEGIAPDEEDVAAVLEETPSESRERFGPIEGVKNVPETKAEAREAVRREMEAVLDHNPYPIKLTLGMQVFSETNGLGNSDGN